MVDIESQGFETFQFTKRNADGTKTPVGEPFLVDVDKAALDLRSLSDQCANEDELVIPEVRKYIVSLGGPAEGISARDIMQFIMAITRIAAEWKKKVDEHARQIGQLVSENISSPQSMGPDA